MIETIETFRILILCKKIDKFREVGRMKNLKIHFVIYALVCLPGCKDIFACGTGLSFFLSDPGEATITSEVLPVCFTTYRFEFALCEEEKPKYKRKEQAERNLRIFLSNLSLMPHLYWL